MIHVSIAPRLAAVTIFATALFFAVLLWFARQAPLTFDDAFNANVALNLAHGLGYGTNSGGTFVGFNPVISTGFLFVAPLSVLLKIIGPSITIVQVYSLAVAFAFFGISLICAWRIHQVLPIAWICLSIVFLSQGKTDLVPNTSVASLPEPLYGLWFQFIGNMSGAWALIACVVACVISGGTTAFGCLSVLICAAFACNAKMIHALPLLVALGCIIFSGPRFFWRPVVSALIGMVLGIKIDSLLARVSLGVEGFRAYKEAAREFFISNQQMYHDFIGVPTWESLVSILGNIPPNLPTALAYVGNDLMLGCCVLSLLSAPLLLWRIHVKKNATILRLLFALGAAMSTVILWWASIPGAPIRFLTVARPLVVATCVVAWIGVTSVSRRGAWISVSLIVYIVFSRHHQLQLARLTLASTLKARFEQEQVSKAVQAARTHRGNVSLCGDRWWYPHAISFLSDTHKTISCSSATTRWVAIPKHIFPAEVVSQMKAGDCTQSYSGEYYELLSCKRRKE